MKYYDMVLYYNIVTARKKSSGYIIIADIWKLLWTFKPTNYAGMSLIWQRSKYKTITNTRVYQQERRGLHLSLSAQKSWSRFYWLDELPVRTAGETGAVVEILPQSLSAFYFVAFLSRAKLPFSSCLSSRSADERRRLGAAEWLRRNVKRPWSCDGWIIFGGRGGRGGCGRRPHHGSLLALQNESFIVSRVPALIWPGETHKASLCTWNTTAVW